MPQFDALTTAGMGPMLSITNLLPTRSPAGILLPTTPALLSSPAELPQLWQLPRDPGLPAPEGGWAQGLEAVLLFSAALRTLLLHKGHIQGKAEALGGGGCHSTLPYLSTTRRGWGLQTTYDHSSPIDVADPSYQGCNCPDSPLHGQTPAV